MFYLFLGLAVGSIGTLVGAGGGFILAPVLLFQFPEMSPAKLTALSLLAVFANSGSGTVGYAVRKQVHWPSVALFSIMAIPGVYVGVYINNIVPRQVFELIFAVFLLVMSGFVVWRSFKAPQVHRAEDHFWNKRTRLIGGFISFFVGILSSLLGIGGGIIHVPLLSEVLLYPVHLAAGSSHAILAITSAVAVLEHFRSGDYNQLESFVPLLVIGLVVGAQLGAGYSKKIKSNWILRILGLALFSVGIRLLLKN